MLNHPRVSPSDNVLRADITPRGRLASYSSNGGYCNNAATVHVWPRSALSYGQESPPRPTRGEGNVSASAGVRHRCCTIASGLLCSCQVEHGDQ